MFPSIFPGPVQAYIALAVREVPNNSTFLTTQVNLAGFLSTVISGMVILEVTIMFFDAEHPLLLSVTVSVYKPALVTTTSSKLADPEITPLEVVHKAE